MTTGRGEEGITNWRDWWKNWWRNKHWWVLQYLQFEWFVCQRILMEVIHWWEFLDLQLREMFSNQNVAMQLLLPSYYFPWLTSWPKRRGNWITFRVVCPTNKEQWSMWFRSCLWVLVSLYLDVEFLQVLCSWKQNPWGSVAFPLRSDE